MVLVPLERLYSFVVGRGRRFSGVGASGLTVCTFEQICLLLVAILIALH